MLGIKWSFKHFNCTDYEQIFYLNVWSPLWLPDLICCTFVEEEDEEKEEKRVRSEITRLLRGQDRKPERETVYFQSRKNTLTSTYKQPELREKGEDDEDGNEEQTDNIPSDEDQIEVLNYNFFD